MIAGITESKYRKFNNFNFLNDNDGVVSFDEENFILTNRVDNKPKNNKTKFIIIIVMIMIAIIITIIFRSFNKEHKAEKLIYSYVEASAECDYDAYDYACIPNWREKIYKYQYEKYGGFTYTYDSYVVEETDKLHSDFKRKYGNKTKCKIEIDNIERVSDEYLSEINNKYNGDFMGGDEIKIKVQDAYNIDCSITIKYKKNSEWVSSDLHYDQLVMIKANNEWSLYVTPNLID